MGAMNALLALAESRIPGIMGTILTAPSFNLLAAYDNSAQAFTASINTAYALTSGTLSAATIVGTNALSSTVSFAAGTVILVDYANAGGSNYEQVTVAAGGTGSGPYTIPLTTALTKAHASGTNISDYPTKTSGHDPALKAGSVFRGLPLLVIAATDDTTVPSSTNATPLITALSPTSIEALSSLTNTGGHSFDLTPFTTGTSAYDIVNFAKKQVGL